MRLQYVQHKVIAAFLRGLVRPRLHLNPKPDEVVSIPLRDTGQFVKVHIYKPATENQKPSPVLLNFCGSGFVLPTFGNDDEFCRYIADHTDYTVIDVQYRLAPEHVFPAAFQDAEDAVKWVRSQPKRFDIDCLSLSGFSSGANIALAVSSSSGLFSQENQNGKPDVFRAVLSFYGPTDLALETPDKTIADPSNWIMRKIFPGFSRLCHKCLNPGVVNPEDPRMSPSFADPLNFPGNVLIITAAQCAFAIEGEKLATTLEAAGKYVKSRRMDGCAHGWDKEALRGTSQCKAKDDAYVMAVEILQRGKNDGHETSRPE